jgi:hypothetical protein
MFIPFIHSFIHPQALMVQNGPLVSLSWFLDHRHTRHTVELPWTNDQPVTETSTYTGQHKRQTSMPWAGFEPATRATKRPQTYALDRAMHCCRSVYNPVDKCAVLSCPYHWKVAISCDGALQWSVLRQKLRHRCTVDQKSVECLVLLSCLTSTWGCVIMQPPVRCESLSQ